MTAVQRSFHRRPLPPPSVAFSSAAGQALLHEALNTGGCACWWLLAEVYHTQAEPAFCGLASLAMALNALGVDPGREWKSSWRWFDENLLDCCVPLEVVAKEGVTLDQVACLARCNGADVTVRRAPPLDSSCQPSDAAATAACCNKAQSMQPEATSVLTAADFEAAVREVCCDSAAHSATPAVLVVSYSRGSMGQSGDGHFSPIGAFAPSSRMVLIMDVARFKYPPHWVPLDRLWTAMQATDSATQKPRGFLLLKPSATLRMYSEHNQTAGVYASLRWTLESRCCLCAPGDDGLVKRDWVVFLTAPQGLQAAIAAAKDGEADVQSVARCVVAAARANGLPHATHAVIRFGAVDEDALQARQALLHATRATRLHAALVQAAGGAEDEDDENSVVLTLLLLAAPDRAWAAAGTRLRAASMAGPDAGGAGAALLAIEVEHLRNQLGALADTGCGPQMAVGVLTM